MGCKMHLRNAFPNTNNNSLSEIGNPLTSLKAVTHINNYQLAILKGRHEHYQLTIIN